MGKVLGGIVFTALGLSILYDIVQYGQWAPFSDLPAIMLEGSWGIILGIVMLIAGIVTIFK
jgi:hypothetical protein